MMYRAVIMRHQYSSVSEFFQQLYGVLNPIAILHSNVSRLEAFNAVTVYVDSEQISTP